MIMVIGATGRIGRAVIDHLLRAGVSVRAVTRRPAAANLPAAVDVVPGDLTKPASLVACLHGVDVVFLLWTAPDATLPVVISQIACHATRIVALTSPHQVAHPFFEQPNAMAALHAHLERLIAAAGVEFTILRPGVFASNALAWWAPTIRDGDVVRWPYGAAEAAPIDERDIAAVAAHALCEDGHNGAEYVLTGPQSLSQVEQVRIIGEVIGRRLRFEEMRAEDFRREMTRQAPGPWVDMLRARDVDRRGRDRFTGAHVPPLGRRPRECVPLLRLRTRAGASRFSAERRLRIHLSGDAAMRGVMLGLGES